ncbi:SGNH/GDSL hydrolase family protein (plasmid) [Methylobacterium phyllosphaerae]
MADENSRSKFIHHFYHLSSTIKYPSPFIGFTGKPGNQYQHIQFDTHGFRNAEAAGPRTDVDEIRVFVLGGSTMVDGDTDADTVSGRLEGELRRMGVTRAKVFNFGVISSCFSQMSALIWSRLAIWEPDALVVVGGGTDVTHPWTFDPRPGYPYNAFVIERIYDYLFDTERIQSRELGLNYDELTSLLYEHLNQLRQEIVWKSDAWERAIIQRTQEVLQRLALLGPALRTPIICVLQPTIVRKRHLDETERRAGSADYLAYLDRQYTRLEEVFAELEQLRQKDRYFVSRNLSGLFADEKRGIFHDAAHYNSLGRQIMAEDLAQCLIPTLKRCRSAPASRPPLRHRLRNLMSLR